MGKSRVSIQYGRKTSRLVALMLQTPMDLRELADALNVNLQGLAELAGDAKVEHALAGLRELAEMQSQLVLSRCRITAAAKLVELAGQSEDGELARKASVDLLKLDLLPAGPDGSTVKTAKPISEAKLLKTLEKMGVEENH